MKKGKLKRLIAFFSALCLCTGMLTSNVSRSSINSFAQTDITEYKEKIDSITEKQKKLDEEIQKAEKDAKDENEKLKLTQQKIDTINEKIELINAELTPVESEIAEKKRLVAQKEKEIERQKKILAKRIRIMYLMGGNENYFQMLADSKDFYDMLMRMELIKRVAKHDNDIIDKIAQTKSEYDKTLTELNAQKSKYEHNTKELEEQRAKLDKLYNSSEELKKEKEQKAKELKAQNDELQAQREQFEQELVSELSSYDVNGAKLSTEEAQELAEKEFDDTKLDFQWPVPSSYDVTSGVGPRWGTQHNGIDISAGKGTDVVAAESGVVVRTYDSCTHNYGKEKSCGCGYGYGNHIVIDYGNGFSSVYGHLTSLNVSVGDTVKKGEKIGTVGSTGYSTGFHLHFEIRYQGTYLNPLIFLNMN
ncbi:MAG: murein hydrolase activator EnvC family protein [Oscillospiraceae bacterium]